MHQPFIATADPPPHLRGWAGDSRANVRGSDLLSSPTVPGKCQACKFIIIKSGAMTLSRFPQCRAFSRALMDEKSLPPLFPVGVWGGGSGYK